MRMKQKSEPIRVAQIMGKLWAGGVEMGSLNTAMVRNSQALAV